MGETFEVLAKLIRYKNVRKVISMRDALQAYTADWRATGNLEEDVKSFLLKHDAEYTYKHVSAVAKTAVDLAQQFGGDATKVEIAALLHDISTVVPNEKRIELARVLTIEVLPAEVSFPMIIHQKLSAVFAEQLFGIIDAEILSAISCHTTLKANASLSDKIVFTADKISWDQQGAPPYDNALQEGLTISIDLAALAYLDYLWDIRESLKVLHPWAFEARVDLYKGLEVVLETHIVCPNCKVSTKEIMPLTSCQYFYKCKQCQEVIRPLGEDCCVYCSYADVPCPPIQEGKTCC